MENKISTSKILLTISMALLLVVAVIGLGLFGTSVNATSPEMGEIVAKADAVHENHAICVGPDDCIKEGCAHDPITTWVPFDLASLDSDANYNYTLPSGNYYLAEDLEFTAKYMLVVKKDEVVNFCLNGKKLSFTNSHKAFKISGTFNLCDCCTETVTHYGSVNDEGVWEASETSGTDDLKGGYITYSQTSSLSSNPALISLEHSTATLNFYSGNIAGVYAYGTYYDLIHNISTSGSTLNIYQGNIIGNSIKRNLIYWEGNINLFGGVISKNTTLYDGISTDAGTTAYVANEISSNCVENFVINASGTTLTANGARIINNTSANSKGILNCDSSTNATIKNTTISGNISEEDGCAVIVRNSTVVFDNTTITNNRSLEDGNALLINTSSNVTLRDTTITNNASQGSASGVLVKTSNATIVTFEGKTIIQNNTYEWTDSGEPMVKNFEYSTNTCTIKIGENGLDDDANIGVTINEALFSSSNKYRYAFLDNAKESDLKYFTSDKENLDEYDRDHRVSIDFDSASSSLRMVLHKYYTVTFNAEEKYSDFGDGIFVDENGDVMDDFFTVEVNPVTRKIDAFPKEYLAEGTTNYEERLYNTMPERAIFRGWYRGSSLATLDYEFTDNSQIKAKWDYAAQLAFTDDSYSNLPVDDFYIYVYADKETQLAIPTDVVPVPSMNFYFKGWSTSINQYKDSAVIDFSTKTFDLNKNYTLYPVWKYTWEMKHDANGGQFSDGTITKLNYTDINDKYVLLDEVPTRTGYTFVGWYSGTNYTTSTIRYVDGYQMSTATVATAKTTVYAGWEEAPTSRQITFNANGGRFEGGATTMTAWTNAETGKFDVLPAAPTRSEYTFTGWYTSSYGGTQITTDTIFTSKSGTTVYAQWKQVVRVTLNLNGGMYTDGTSSYQYPDPVTGKFDVLPPAPTKGTSIFLGWYTSSSGGTQITTNYVFSYNTTIYARWWNIYNVTFNTNGGSFSNGDNYVVLSTQGTDGTQGRLSSFPAETPTRDGYNFIGWSSSTNYFDEITTSRTFYNNTTVYAYWEKIGANFHPCNFNDTIIVTDEGNGITAPENITFDSYIFIGWATEESDITKLTTTFASPNHYYAVWAKDNDESGTYNTGDVIVRTNGLDLSNATEDITNDEQGWSWDQDTLTLTLDGVDFYFTGSDYYLTLPDGSTIVLTDDSYNKVYYSICGYGDLAIRGDATLIAYDDLYAEGDLRINCTEAVASDICAYGNLYVEGGMLVATYSIDVSYAMNVAFGAKVVSKYGISADSGISVNGSQITGASQTFVEGETTKLYDENGSMPVIIGVPTIISEIDIQFNKNSLPAIVPGAYKYSDAFYIAFFEELKSSNAMVSDMGILKISGGTVDTDDYSSYLEEGYSYVAMLWIVPEYGSIFAENVTVNNSDFIIYSRNNVGLIQVYINLGTASYATINEVEVELSDNFFDYYYIGGNMYDEASEITDIVKVDLTKPYLIDGAGIFIYDENAGRYVYDEYYNGFVAGVKYAFVVSLVTGYNFTESGGINASGYRFASTVTNVAEGWIVTVYEGQYLEALYELPVLEAQTISEIDISLSDNFFDYYYAGGNMYEEASNLADIVKVDLTKPYLIYEFGLYAYDEEYDEYVYVDYDDFDGFVAGVKYAIEVYVVTGFDFTEYDGINASGYLFANSVTNATEGWTITVYENKFINAFYELEVLEAETISEIDVDFSDNFFDYYYIGGNMYDEVTELADIVKVDLTKPYLIYEFGLYAYDEEYDEYVYVDYDDFDGFVAGVKYAIEVYVVTGFDFTEYDGINASGYLFANSVTNATEGWTITVYENKFINAFYELEVLEAETISEIDVDFSDNFFTDYYFLGGNIYNAQSLSDLVKIDLTKPYLIFNLGLYAYNEESEEYAYVDYDDFTGFEIGVKYAVEVYVVTGYDFTMEGGINASGYLFASTVTNATEGWSITVEEGQYLTAFYELEVLTPPAIDEDELEITLTNNLVYNGSAQTQNATVVYADETLVAGVDYVISGNVATNAGNYVMTITFIGDYSGEITRSYAVAKAVYDMSGITMSNKTVTYDGETHSIAIEGTLPSGVSVSYDNNDKVDAGVYTVTANFTGNANYEAINSISATLTIKAIVYEDTEKDEETGKPVVKVENENGFDPTVELVVEVVAVEIEIAEIKVEISDKEDIAVAYDVSLFQDGVSVQPNGIIRIKMLIPANLLGIQFRIVHIHDGEEIGDVEYTVEDRYAVIETDKLSAFVFIYEPSVEKFSYSNPLIGWISLGVIVLFGIVLAIIFLNKRTIKFDSNGIAFENEEFGEIRAFVGQKVKLPIPFAQNYQFIGWYYDKECTQKADVTKMGIKSLVLYAKWEEISQRNENNTESSNN